MKNICFYFEIHQPERMKRYRFFDIGQDHYYFDEFQTEERMRDYAMRSYLKANHTILEMIKSSEGQFKCSFSISGIALELFELYAPEVIESFQELAATNCVEFLVEPYYHSLASVFNTAEFEIQVKQHAEKITQLFKKKPVTFRNAELIYSDEIGEVISKLGYKTVLIDEARQIMGWKSPNYVYTHSYISKLKILVRNYKLSDDLAFRFSDRSWFDYPLSAGKYIDWIAAIPEPEKIINIWMGYEALGVFQSVESGIFDFFKALPELAKQQNIGFILPSEAVKSLEPIGGPLTVSHSISWSGNEKDLFSWTGNDLQNEALHKLYAVSERVHLTSNKSLKHDWGMLQASDHFRFMNHRDAFGTNFESAYEAFTNYMNVLADFLQRVDEQYPTTIENEELNELLTTIRNQDVEIEELQAELARVKSRKTKTTEV